MRKIALLVVLMLVAVPAALAANSPSPNSPSTLCKQQRNAIGMGAFKLLYGSNNAYGKCVSKAASAASQNTANASKQCAAERADANVRRLARRQDVRAVLRQRPERPQRLRQVRLQQGPDAPAGTAAGHDQRCEGLQDRAQFDGRRRVHGEVRRPLQRLREMRLQAVHVNP